MSVCLVMLGVLLGCAGEPPSPPDRWIAEDKIQHFTVSAAATTMGYGGARFVLERDHALIAAGATALALGIGKEVRDVSGGGPFSVKDLVWDAAGVGLGLILVDRIR